MNSIKTLILKDYKSLYKKTIIQLTLTKENKVIIDPLEVKTYYFTASDENTDNMSIDSGLLTIESVNNIFKKLFEEQPSTGKHFFPKHNTTPNIS